MGGNVFAGQTVSISRERIEPTLKRYFSELTVLFPSKAEIFNLNCFSLLGSAGKKSVSNDVDLGVSSELIFGDGSDASILSWKLDPELVEQETQSLQKRARTATIAQSRRKAFFKLLCRHINTHSNNIHCDEKKVSEGNIFSLFPQYDEQGNITSDAVQIDWMCGNIEWLRFSYYSDVYDEASNVKGLCRTQLLLSAFQLANASFNHVSGVRDKITGDILAATPEMAVEVLNKRLNLALSVESVANFYTLHNHLREHLSVAQYAVLLKIYFKILDSTRVDIPDVLQEAWRLKKTELGLTGKFLPSTSNLVGA